MAMWLGIVVGLVGLALAFKPEWFTPLFDWKAKAVGGKVTPPANAEKMYRIVGIVLVIIGAYLAFLS